MVRILRAMVLSSVVLLAAAAVASAATLSGKITRVDAKAKTIVVNDGWSDVTFSVPSDAAVMQGARPKELVDLHPGNQVKVEYSIHAGRHVASHVDLSTRSAKK